MAPAPTLPWFELARFARSHLTRIALVAVTVVPLLYGGLYIWANLDPTGRLDQVDAAIVNADELVETTGPDGEQQSVAVGRLLAANLIGNDDADNYDWHLTDATDASRGLADGSYKAVLTIPENLSAAATSTSGDPAKAVQGRLDLKTNDAVNYVNGTIAQTILTAAREALNAQVTETYLDNVYLGFSDIRVALGDAADGAGKLGDGASELADGNQQLADGAGQLADGAEQLAAGTRELDAGASQLAGGLSTLDDRTGSLPGDTRRLADGARQVATGTNAFSAQITEITDTLLAATDGANEDIDALAAQLDTLADQCEAEAPQGIDCSTLRDAAGRSGELKDFVGGVRGQATEARDGARQLASGAGRVADGNEQLADSVPALVGAIGRASTGADQLADGTGQLAARTGEAAAGAGQLVDGLDQATTGAEQLAQGAYDLQAGLDDGRGDVPDYSDDDDREQLARTAATPVEDAAERMNGVDGYGAGLAPYFMALALWVGAMAIYLLLRPLSARAIASTAGSVRTALAGFAPGVALSAVQAVLLVAIVVGLIGVDAPRPWLMLATALAAGVVFTALNQMFVALFGPAGRFVAVVFVCLQLTSAGGTYPIETAPGLFGFLHGLLPMTYVVDLFRAATTGGGESVGSDFAILALFTLGALAVTTLAAFRKQHVTLARLHPTLVV